MNREKKIQALQALQEGDLTPMRALLSRSPNVVQFIEHEGLYYLNFGDLVLNKAEFGEYTGGNDLIAKIPHNHRDEFRNANLPTGIIEHSTKKIH